MGKRAVDALFGLCVNYLLPNGKAVLVNMETMQVDGEVFEEHLGLAEVIALEYSNIPGAEPSESISEAHQALLRSARLFDPAKGEFTPYAARAIRNALNSFYAKQLRLAKLFPESLDAAPDWDSGGTHDEASAGGILGKVGDSKQDVRKKVRLRETSAVLGELMQRLSPRERRVIEAIRQGKSLAEIGEGMGISKQAVHKISAPALARLRAELESLGFGGIDSVGLLKSRSSPGKERLG